MEYIKFLQITLLELGLYILTCINNTITYLFITGLKAKQIQIKLSACAR